MKEIAIIDYDIGNIRSVSACIEKVGAKAKLTRNFEEIMNSDGVILPGVGAFSYGMAKLEQYSLDHVIKNFIATGKPLLGICLGMQLLFSESYEFGYTHGLNLITGSVKKLKLLNSEVQKLPHIGWSNIEPSANNSWGDSILENISSKEHMYFCHSFIAIPENKSDILSYTNYSDNKFCSAVKHGNVYGVQFHPERSSTEGLKIIENFTSI